MAEFIVAPWKGAEIEHSSIDATPTEPLAVAYLRRSRRRRTLSNAVDLCSGGRDEEMLQKHVEVVYVFICSMRLL